MKVTDVLGGFKLPLSEEEANIAGRIKSKDKVYKSDLQEREAEVARQLVTRGVLGRYRDNDGTYYTFQGLDDCWRDRD